MNHSKIVLAAILLDLALGDPPRVPHPVRWIGKFARKLEIFTRHRIKSPFIAGACTAIIIYLTSFFIPFFIIKTIRIFSPLAADLFSIITIYTTIALRDLLNHSQAVYQEIRDSNISQARKKIGMIVARDTKNLTKKEIIRACVESVAESMVDGITAPIFFAIFGGPSAAMLYRSINTLDSLFGYRNEKYGRFGTISARADDIANFIPARITAPWVSLASLLLGLNARDSITALIRDGRKHPSPNSGLAEAAVAGALGVRLGGVNYYSGIKNRKPFLGLNKQPFQPNHILQVNRLVFVTSFIVFLFYLCARYYFMGTF